MSTKARAPRKAKVVANTIVEVPEMAEVSEMAPTLEIVADTKDKKENK